MKITEITKLNIFNVNKLFELREPTGNSSNRKKGELPGDDKEAIFIGPEAKTYNDAQEVRARRMEKEGYTRNEIWWETGTFRTVNGDWRQEISDRNLRIKDTSKLKQDKTYKFSDIIDHEALYKAYPFLKDYKIQISDKIDVQGNWNPTTKMVKIHPDYLNRFVAVHELQHAAQQVEKPEDVKYKGTKEFITKTVPGILTDYDSYLAYHKEMDARTAEKRMDYEDWKLKLNVPTEIDSKYMTIQDRPKTGPQYDSEVTTTGSPHQKYNPLKTVLNPFHWSVGGDDWKNDPMQKDINKNIRGNVPKNMKVGDMAPGKDFKPLPPHTHPHQQQGGATPTNIPKPKPRPKNLGKNQNTTTTVPKPRPANLGNQVK